MKKIIIIGGGISGLTSGIYATQNDYEALIIEKNPRMGGLCTTWKRKGYLIDGCVHWLTGTKKGTDLYNMWTNVHAFEDEGDIIYPESFGSYEYKGTVITCYSDIDKFERELLRISPEDKKPIKWLSKMIRRTTSIPLPLDMPVNMMNLWKLLKVGFRFIPYILSYLRLSHMSCQTLANKFKNETIRWALLNSHTAGGNAFSYVYAYATIVSDNGGVPKGGSQTIVDNMENYFLSNGGKIRKNTEVDEILIENKKAVGVRLSNGEIIKGDYVISDVDANITFDRFLKGKYHDKNFSKRRENIDTYPTPMCLQLSYAIDLETASKLDTLNSFKCKPLRVGSVNTEHLNVRNYSFDPTFTRNGKTLCTILIGQSIKDYPFWKELYRHKDLYEMTKSIIGKSVEDRIISEFPQLKGKFELLDVTSPITYERYVGAYKGAYMAYALTDKGKMLIHKGYVKGIKNLYLGGQWLQMPGGLPLALATGQFAIQRINKKEKKKFSLQFLTSRKRKHT